MKCRSRIAVALILIAGLYAGLASWMSITVMPRADEGFFASPAINLATTGSMGTSVLEGSHEFMKDIHKYTYWMTPLHFLAQAAWYKVFGFSLFSMRALSIVFALGALAAWFAIARRISGCDALAVLTVALVGLDYNYTVVGSSGRMDIMAACLGFTAFAAYLTLRERNFTAALVLSNALVCAAGLTHPVAGYLYISGLLFLVLYYDRSRLRLQHVPLAALPYLVGFSAWGLYIMEDPGAFVAQFSTNLKMHRRLSGFSAPWMGLVNEIRWRYFLAFGLRRHSLPNEGPVSLKALILAAFVAGVVGAAFSRKIRANKGYRALMLLAVIFFLLLSIVDGQKAYYYLIHVFPFYAALTAAWIFHLWQRRRVPRPIIAVCVGGLLALQLGAVVYRARQNTYSAMYEPAIAFLKRAAKPGETIMGSAGLGFGLNFAPNLVDDVRLGYYSGRRPQYIVVNREYALVFSDYRNTDPPIYDFIVNRLTREYDRVYDRIGYQVYAVREEKRFSSAPSASLR